MPVSTKSTPKTPQQPSLFDSPANSTPAVPLNDNPPPKLDQSRQWHYAINLADLTSFIRPGKFSPIQLLLAPILVNQGILCEREKWDGMAAPVKADIPHERWEAIYQIIRQGVGQQQPIPKHKLRIYRSKSGRGGWERI